MQSLHCDCWLSGGELQGFNHIGLVRPTCDISTSGAEQVNRCLGTAYSTEVANANDGTNPKNQGHSLTGIHTGGTSSSQIDMAWHADWTFLQSCCAGGVYRPAS